MLPWSSAQQPTATEAAIERPASEPEPPASPAERRVEAPQPATASVAPATSPPPAVTSPAAVMPKTATRSQDDADVVIAYELLKAGQVDESRRMAETIAGRNPQLASLGVLRAAIDARVEDDRRREDLARATAKQEERARELDARTAERQPSGPAAATDAPPALVLPPTVAPPHLERPAIVRVLEEWAAALATRDIAIISRVRSLTPTEAESWKNTFGRVRSYRLHVEMIDNPQIVGNHALVPIEEVVIMTDQRGIDLTMSPRRYNYRMHKVGGQWRLLPPNTPMPSQTVPDAR